MQCFIIIGLDREIVIHKGEWKIAMSPFLIFIAGGHFGIPFLLFLIVPIIYVLFFKGYKANGIEL